MTYLFHLLDHNTGISYMVRAENAIKAAGYVPKSDDLEIVSMTPDEGEVGLLYQFIAEEQLED